MILTPENLKQMQRCCQFYNRYHVHFSKFRISVNGKSVYQFFMFSIRVELWNAHSCRFKELNQTSCQIQKGQATGLAHGCGGEVLFFLLWLVNHVICISTLHPLFNLRIILTQLYMCFIWKIMFLYEQIYKFMILVFHIKRN